jgi:hypothetical protein
MTGVSAVIAEPFSLAAFLLFLGKGTSGLRVVELFFS